MFVKNKLELKTLWAQKSAVGLSGFQKGDFLLKICLKINIYISFSKSLSVFFPFFLLSIFLFSLSCHTKSTVYSSMYLVGSFVCLCIYVTWSITIQFSVTQEIVHNCFFVCANTNLSVPKKPAVEWWALVHWKYSRHTKFHFT